MSRIAKRVAVFALTLLVALVVGTPLAAVPSALVTTVILAIGLTVDDHVAHGRADSATLRRRITLNIVMAGLAAVIMTVAAGPPGSS